MKQCALLVHPADHALGASAIQSHPAMSTPTPAPEQHILPMTNPWSKPHPHFGSGFTITTTHGHATPLPKTTNRSRTYILHVRREHLSGQLEVPLLLGRHHPVTFEHPAGEVLGHPMAKVFGHAARPPRLARPPSRPPPSQSTTQPRPPGAAPTTCRGASPLGQEERGGRHKPDAAPPPARRHPTTVRPWPVPGIRERAGKGRAGGATQPPA